MAVVDASVMTALFFPGDQHHPASAAWFESVQLAATPLQAPSLLLVELVAALTRRGVDRATVLEIIREVREDVQIHPIDEGLLELAQEVALRCRTRGYDSVYVALAAHLGEWLVTADGEQAERGAQMARTHDLRTGQLREPPAPPPG